MSSGAAEWASGDAAVPRSGPAAGCDGYFHETALYSSDEEFLAIAEPFLRGGQEAGEPTIVSCAVPNASLIRAALDDIDGITFTPAESRYVNPASTIRAYRQHFARLVDRGASQIRVIGDVPHPGAGVPWENWARYEGAVNHAFDDFPVWGVCPYDLRTTPEEVVEDVIRLHPRLFAEGEHHENHHFTDPADVLTQLQPAPEPIEWTPPHVQALDPTPAFGRQLAGDLARTAGLPSTETSDLEIAVSEVVTNARTYGTHPVELRGWSTPGRVVVRVHDAGTGPTDPFVGLVEPQVNGTSGRGLWIAHQLCSDTSLWRDDTGFTVRLIAGSLR